MTRQLESGKASGAVRETSGPGSPRNSRGRDRTSLRKFVDVLVAVLTGLAVLAVLFPLVDIIFESFVRGGGVLFQAQFLTAQQPPACSALSCRTTGIAPDIEGSFVMVALAALIAVPIGVLAAIFASEYRGLGLGRAISFTADVLTGIPSIIAGAFVYTYFVEYSPTFALSPQVHIPSAIAGALALSIIMIPIVTRTTEESLRVVPESMREGALALGISKWKSTLRIVLIASLPGTLTGVLLAMMRAAGEAAPLLFTASGSPYYLQGVNGPTGALPLLIFSFAQEQPYPNWVEMAWGATLFLLIFVLTANVLSRMVIRRLERRMGRI